MTSRTTNTTKSVVKREIVALSQEEAGFVMERRAAARASTLIPISPGAGESVSLRVQSQEEPDVRYKIGVKVPLKILMKDYCNRRGFAYGTLRFLIDGNRVRGKQTPQELAMEEDDIIDAFSDQTGGSCCS